MLLLRRAASPTQNSAPQSNSVNIYAGISASLMARARRSFDKCDVPFMTYGRRLHLANDIGGANLGCVVTSRAQSTGTNHCSGTNQPRRTT
jgi:hypothetical protein